MISTLVGVIVLLIALVDCFEAMVLPRQITRRWRLTRLYYRTAWILWRRVCKFIPAGRYRENILSVFGPLSLLGLFACWAAVMITGFALVHWGGQTLPVAGTDLLLHIYHSGETFFTLGYGDITPATHAGKLLAIVEAGTGFGFMAIVIGYLPVLYQAFSHRERCITLLDARAGSPPTASELLRRSGNPLQCQEIERFLVEWEAWSAELLESHLSFPLLGFYRSQHNNQSWLAALALMLDSTAVLIITGSDQCRRRAELTFAMARHACVDLCLIFWLPPVEPTCERLTVEETKSLFAGSSPLTELTSEQVSRLHELRELYEPFLQALSNYFCLKVPRFVPDRTKPDNWQTSAWMKRAPGITELPSGAARADKHFG